MTQKINGIVIALEPEGIWYAEEGDTKVFIGVVKNRTGEEFFVSTMALNKDQARIQLLQQGAVISVMALSDMLACHIDIPANLRERIL
jgi:hypothetical protein